MLEFIEGLAAMAVLDQDGVYTYVSPGWERYTPTAPPLPPIFPALTGMGSCAGCFSMSSSRVWRTLRT